MTRKLSFVVVEKSYIIRSGLFQILDNFSEMESFTEFENLDTMEKDIDYENTDVLIINAKLVDTSPEIILEIRKKYENIKLVVLAGTRRAGEKFPNFDLKISVDEEKIILANKFRKLIKSIQPSDSSSGSDELSEREADIVKQIALGKTNKEIAEILFISPHTVITHRKNITGKLGIKTVSGLTAFAILNNLIKIDDAV